MHADVSGSNQERLRRLHQWLRLEGSGAVGFLVLLAGVPFVPVVTLLGIAALLFTPYLLLMLFQTGHRAWMVGFALMVGIPSLLWLLPGASAVITAVVRLLPFFMFYLYCWLLRSRVEEWLEA